MTIAERTLRFLNRPYNGRPLLAVLSTLAVASAFVFWIWPTPYREWISQDREWISQDRKRVSHGWKHGKVLTVYHRINRFNGAREYSFPGFFGTTNWQPESSPAQQTEIKTNIKDKNMSDPN